MSNSNLKEISSEPERLNPAPAYQFYPKDMISDPTIAALSLEEFGLFLRLCCYLWLEENFIFNVKKIAKLLRITPKKFQNLFEPMKEIFEISDGIIRYQKLEDERRKQANWRAKSIAGGLKSAEIRRKGGSQMVETVVQPNGNIASSSSIAFASAKENSLRSSSFAAPAAHSLSSFSDENDDAAKVSTVGKIFEKAVGRGDPAKTANLPQRKEIFNEWKQRFDATRADFHSGDGYDRTLWKRFNEGLTAEQMSAAIKGFALKSPELQTGKKTTNFQKIFGTKDDVLEFARIFNEQRRAE